MKHYRGSFNITIQLLIALLPNTLDLLSLVRILRMESAHDERKSVETDDVAMIHPDVRFGLSV
jgi:hypothetical protein